MPSCWLCLQNLLLNFLPAFGSLLPQVLSRLATRTSTLLNVGNSCDPFGILQSPNRIHLILYFALCQFVQKKVLVRSFMWVIVILKTQIHHCLFFVVSCFEIYFSVWSINFMSYFTHFYAKGQVAFRSVSWFNNKFLMCNFEINFAEASLPA